jgi:hypothetical protein
MNKKIEERTELERTTALIANLVFGFNGSDPEVKKRQVGLKYATEIVGALIETERKDAVLDFHYALPSDLDSFGKQKFVEKYIEGRKFLSQQSTEGEI